MGYLEVDYCDLDNEEYSIENWWTPEQIKEMDMVYKKYREVLSKTKVWFKLGGQIILGHGH